MVLKIAAPCVSDGSGNPVIANKTKCSVAICFYFTDCFFRALYFIAMTDCNGQREIASKTEFSLNKKTANRSKSGSFCIYSDFLFFYKLTARRSFITTNFNEISTAFQA